MPALPAKVDNDNFPVDGEWMQFEAEYPHNPLVPGSNPGGPTNHHTVDTFHAATSVFITLRNIWSSTGRRSSAAGAAKHTMTRSAVTKLRSQHWGVQQPYGDYTSESKIWSFSLYS